MGLIEDAIARADARPVKRIDYERMNRSMPKLKAKLTRAKNSGDPEKVAAACKEAIDEWNEIGAWPDDWAHWQRTLDDMLPWNRHVDIRDL
jgi:hypothetical protein